jgi:hypothetical protein
MPEGKKCSTSPLMPGRGSFQRVKEEGGVAVLQELEDAAADSMAKCAIMAVKLDHVVTLAALPQLFINALGKVRVYGNSAKDLRLNRR